MAEALQKRIFDRCALTASAGVSYNKFLAKCASDFRKPAGLTLILPEEASAFLDELPVEKFHGIGKVSAHLIVLKLLALNFCLRLFLGIRPAESSKTIF